MPGSSKLKLTIHPCSTVNWKEGEGALCLLQLCCPRAGVALSKGQRGTEPWIVHCLPRRQERDLFSRKANWVLGNYLIPFISHCTLSAWVNVSIWNEPASSVLPASDEAPWRALGMEAPLRPGGQSRCGPSPAPPLSLRGCSCLRFFCL